MFSRAIRIATPQFRSFSAAAGLKPEYEFIKAEIVDGAGLITLHRPKALNALCDGLLNDLIHAARVFDADDRVGAIVVTGSDRAFAAGADIKEMSKKTYVEAYTKNMFQNWTDITTITKPTIAAVSGFALGGGCELAMMCDIIIASESAKFGQPEITLGVIPGCGGTQRLIRAIGKAKAMEMVLTGNMITAAQAERDGLVCKVVPNDQLLSTALAMANKIASFSRPAVAMAKETVNSAYELNLAEGLRFERRIFHSMFSLDDQKEGMGAFIEKRGAKWTHKHGESVWNVTDPSRGLKTKFSGWADIALTDRGREQAAAAGRCLKELGCLPKTACTSLLRRSRETYDIIATLNDYSKVTVINSWRLNERHYGALVGLVKDEAKSLYDPVQLIEWRRSWDKAPPKMNNANLQLWNKAAWTKPVTTVAEPGKQKVIVTEKGVSLPESESLEDCCQRVRVLWELIIAPKLVAGETVLIVAHANSIRSMVRFIDYETMSTDSVRDVHIPSATPLIYDFIVKSIPADSATSVNPSSFPSPSPLGVAAPSADGMRDILLPVGTPTPLGMRGRFVVNKELATLGTTAKNSWDEQLCYIH